MLIRGADLLTLIFKPYCQKYYCPLRVNSLNIFIGVVPIFSFIINYLLLFPIHLPACGNVTTCHLEAKSPDAPQRREILWL